MEHKPKIGITERGDAGINFEWERASVEGMILITKRISKDFINRAAKVNAIIHATITGHGGTMIEPGVKTVSESIPLFRELVQTIGKERVILRIDPIIPTEDGIARALNVYHSLKGEGTRIRISIMDNYPHVRSRFKAAGTAPLDYRFHAPLQQRREIIAQFKDAEVCGEPGIACTGCVSAADLQVLNIQADGTINRTQRRDCACISLKTELLKNRGQCPHGCLYCYWR